MRRVFQFLGYFSKNMFPPGLEPGTFRVLGERDNHYTTETWDFRAVRKFIDPLN